MISLAYVKSIFAFLFISFTISTCGFEQSFHQPKTPANILLSVVITDCDGVIDEKKMTVIQNQLAERLKANEVFYQSINTDLGKRTIDLGIIKAKDESKSIDDIRKVLIERADLKLVTAVRVSDPIVTNWGDKIKEDEEGIESVLEFNEMIVGGYGKYPTAVLATCKNENFAAVKEIITRYEKEIGIIFRWGKNNQIIEGELDAKDWLLYGYLENETNVVSSKDVREASAGPDEYNGEIVVMINMSEEGGRTFATMTKKATNDAMREILIIVNQEVYSAPKVNGEIAGGRCTISGNFNLKEANTLAALLNAGALVCEVEITSEESLKE